MGLEETGHQRSNKNYCVCHLTEICWERPCLLELQPVLLPKKVIMESGGLIDRNLVVDLIKDNLSAPSECSKLLFLTSFADRDAGWNWAISIKVAKIKRGHERFLASRADDNAGTLEVAAAFIRGHLFWVITQKKRVWYGVDAAQSSSVVWSGYLGYLGRWRNSLGIQRITITTSVHISLLLVVWLKGLPLLNRASGRFMSRPMRMRYFFDLAISSRLGPWDLGFSSKNISDPPPQ
jgi:hypothetical protein